MNTNTSSVGGAGAMPSNKQYATSKVGVNLNQLLDMSMGKVDISSLKTDAERQLHKELAPRYDADRVRVTIEEQVLYRSLEPHLVDLQLDIPDPIPVISRYGSIIASEGNISAVVGAAKSKKTFLCTALVGALLRQNNESIFGINAKNTRVLWIDTEQSELHARKVVERIHRLAGWSDRCNNGMFHSLTLREIEPKERAELLYMAIELYRPHLVVVDGISDLMHNTNDIEESDRIVGRLMALSTEFNCHILCVLHTNPNSDKARGHIGSTLQRKAETVIFVHKVGDCSVVEPQFCRNEEFRPFAFTIDEEGLPVECPLPQEGGVTNDCVRIMQAYYPNGIERTILVEKMVSEMGITLGTARVKVTRAVQSGLLLCPDGKSLYLPTDG